MHARTRVVDGKVPVVAGDIPVELVVVGEESELAIRSVGDRVSVFTTTQEDMLVTHVDAHAVAAGFCVVGFELPVASYRQDLEADTILIAEAVLVERREVAVNAAFDLIAFGAYADRLHHGHGRVRMHLDVAFISENALVRGNRVGRQP